MKKQIIKSFKEVFEQGITIEVNGAKIYTEAGIRNLLKLYDNASSMLNDLRNAINALSDVAIKDKIYNEEKTKEEERIAAEKAAKEAADLATFKSIKGEEYKITDINWDAVDGRYSSGSEIHERGKGWSGSRDKAYAEGEKILRNKSLKSQMRSKIEAVLVAHGLTFDRVASVFEEIYNESVTDTLNASGIITGRGARGLSKDGHAYINVKQLCDTFIDTFNTKFAAKIDQMNAG